MRWKVGQVWRLPGGSTVTVEAVDEASDRAYCIFPAGNNCTYGPLDRETWTLMAPKDGPVICSVCQQEALHPEHRGTMWRRKGQPGFALAWSRTLIEIAGGYDRLMAEWEIDDERP